MAIPSRGTLGLLKHTAVVFWNDDCPRMAAALSYYTVFSLPGLLILLVTIAGWIWDPQDVRGAIEGQSELGRGSAFTCTRCGNGSKSRSRASRTSRTGTSRALRSTPPGASSRLPATTKP